MSVILLFILFPSVLEIATQLMLNFKNASIVKGPGRVLSTCIEDWILTLLHSFCGNIYGNRGFVTIKGSFLTGCSTARKSMYSDIIQCCF